MVQRIAARWVVFAAVALLASWAHAQFQVDTRLTIDGYREAFDPSEEPPDVEALGDLVAFEVVRQFLRGAGWIGDGGRPVVLLEAAAEGSGDSLCAADIDGQKLRIAGGHATWGPAAFEVDDDTATIFPQILWVFDAVEMLASRGISLKDGPDQTLVIIDDFAFDAIGSDDDFMMHGNAVLHHVLQLFDSVQSVDLGSVDVHTAQDGSTVEFVEIEVGLNNERTATLALVDFDFDVDVDFSHLAAAIEFASSRTSGQPVASVNLSWNLVPCAFHDPEGNSAYESYVHFLWELAKDPDDLDLFVDLYGQFQDLPAFDGSDQASFNFRVILAAAEDFANRELHEADRDDAIDPARWFGSAGNQGLGFPLPPASFSNVTSVAACEVSGETDDLGVARWSNAGRVATMGAWFERDASTAPYGGTSFAAPLAALLSLHATSPSGLDGPCIPLGTQ